MLDIAIVGAGPAGYSAAITARKRDKSVLVIGQHMGWLARAEHIANYPGLPDVSGPALLESMRAQAQALGTQLRPGVSPQCVAITEDGVQYGIDLVQRAEDVYPASMDLTLTKIEQKYEVSHE